MNAKTTPIATLGALMAAVTEAISASEQRVLADLDEIRNRVIGLEDTLTEMGKQADEIKDEILKRVDDIKDAVEAFDTSPINDVADILDDLVDAEHRRERLSWLPGTRVAS